MALKIVSTLSTFVLAMVKYPGVQQKAQAELDSVISQGRLPSFDQQNLIPSLMAIVKECLRWQVVTPLGIPHVLTADDEYAGYTLPAGTICISNIWCV